MGPDAERAIREERERTRSALASSNTAVWELDLDSGFVTWSANLETLIKRPVDRIGLEESLRLVHPADADRVRAVCLAAKKDHSSCSVEFRLIWPDGTVRWLQSMGRVLEAAAGLPLRLIGSTVDVTDRRALDVQLGGIAHDFNNLLSVIQGFGQVLAERVSNAKQAADIREVLQATERARVLARQLLSLTRHEVVAQEPAAATSPVLPKAGPKRAAAGRKVLVIEDQGAVRALVRRILEREGFGVLEAADSPRAERLFDEHQTEIALVITDVGIPGERGTVLLRRLASKKPDLRIVYMSGQVEEAVLGDAPHAPHERFLAKPFTAAGLIGVVQDALRE
jgi:PAS domain S-box-containing protein